MKRARWLALTLAQGLTATALGVSLATASEPVDLKFQRTLAIKGTDVPYDLSFELTDVALTRIGINALLDLRSVQAAMTNEFDGQVVVDICNTKIGLTGMTLSAQGEDISAQAGVNAEIYECTREGGTTADRGERVFAQTVSFQAAASVQIDDQCVRFGLANAQVTLDGTLEPTDEQQAFLDQARTQFLTTVGAFLDKHPICIDLPAELASLRPSYDSGGTHELGQGGIGVYFKGSVEVSTAALIDVLQVLQDNAILPPRP